MPLHPYIHFQGQCAEALSFYAQVFGAPEPKMVTYAEAPGMPAGTGGGRIVHGQLEIAGGVLMASDFPPGLEGDPQQGFSVTATLPGPAEAQARFEALAEGAEVLQPFGPSFVSEGFGMLKDRFGTHWIIMVETRLQRPELPADP
ncbi:MAG: VOC family protein [Pararhodobacter sp.]